MESLEKPIIFKYDNYREFLKAVFEYKKQSDRSFSIRNFARLAGFKAHSFVVGILQGKKDLSININNK